MVDYAKQRTTMVDTQVRPSDVTKYPIIDAMLSVPREDFVPIALREVAYVGDSVALGDGRVVLEPRTFAKLLEAVDIQPDELVLDVGAGLGYSSAVVAHLAEAVVALEEVAEMAVEAERLLGGYGADNAAVIAGILGQGAEKHGPYDVIMIEGGVENIPAKLVAQLKDGGRIAAVFIENGLGICRIGHKFNGQTSWRDAFNAGAPLLAGFENTRVFAL